MRAIDHRGLGLGLDWKRTKTWEGSGFCKLMCLHTHPSRRCRYSMLISNNFWVMDMGGAWEESKDGWGEDRWINCEVSLDSFQPIKCIYEMLSMLIRAWSLAAPQKQLLRSALKENFDKPCWAKVIRPSSEDCPDWAVPGQTPLVQCPWSTWVGGHWEESALACRFLNAIALSL